VDWSGGFPNGIKSGLGCPTVRLSDRPAVWLSSCPTVHVVATSLLSGRASGSSSSGPAVVYDRIKITLNNTQCQNGQSAWPEWEHAYTRGQTRPDQTRPLQTHDPRRIPSQKPAQPSPSYMIPTHSIPSTQCCNKFRQRPPALIKPRRHNKL